MTLRLVIDMNLSPEWVHALDRYGRSSIGDPRATDRTIMDWARANNHIVFTHDLDFGTMLALTHATGPSVLQVRGQDVLPDHLAPIVAAALDQHKRDLIDGALVVVDEARSRVRLLPI